METSTTAAAGSPVLSLKGVSRHYNPATAYSTFCGVSIWTFILVR